jgi:hypothetical protein
MCTRTCAPQKGVPDRRVWVYTRAGTVLSYDWITELYKVTLADGKVIATPLPSPEYAVADEPAAQAGGGGGERGGTKDVAQDVSVQAYRGVRSMQEAGKWAAEIKRDGRQIRLGVYGSIEAAARAYDRAAHEVSLVRPVLGAECFLCPGCAGARTIRVQEPVCMCL